MRDDSAGRAAVLTIRGPARTLLGRPNPDEAATGGSDRSILAEPRGGFDPASSPVHPCLGRLAVARGALRLAQGAATDARPLARLEAPAHLRRPARLLDFARGRRLLPRT